MKKLATLILSAAVLAPLALTAPAEAQSHRDIQRLEERVQEAKQRGDWSAAQQLEVQLNMTRLQYQRERGIPEFTDNPQYQYNRNRGYYPYNRGSYDYRNNQRGYYDNWGNWRSY